MSDSFEEWWLDYYGAGNKWHRECAAAAWYQQQARIEELEVENKRLRKALDKYGVHSPYCVSHIHKKCDCGLREALLQENNDE